MIFTSPWQSLVDHQAKGYNMGNIVTRFTERFGCKHPFACAGMAFAGMTPDLALAVCRGGGVGALVSGHRDCPGGTERPIHRG
jgi:hypothetical protein